MAIIRETTRGYNVLAEEDILATSRKVFLTGEINPESSSDLLKRLMALDEENSNEISLHIQWVRSFFWPGENARYTNTHGS